MAKRKKQEVVHELKPVDILHSEIIDIGSDDTGLIIYFKNNLKLKISGNLHIKVERVEENAK